MNAYTNLNKHTHNIPPLPPPPSPIYTHLYTHTHLHSHALSVTVGCTQTHRHTHTYTPTHTTPTASHLLDVRHEGSPGLGRHGGVGSGGWRQNIFMQPLEPCQQPLPALVHCFLQWHSTLNAAEKHITNWLAGWTLASGAHVEKHKQKSTYTHTHWCTLYALYEGSQFLLSSFCQIYSVQGLPVLHRLMM